jgi:hypothetical protein
MFLPLEAETNGCQNTIQMREYFLFCEVLDSSFFVFSFKEAGNKKPALGKC